MLTRDDCHALRRTFEPQMAKLDRRGVAFGIWQVFLRSERRGHRAALRGAHASAKVLADL
jgi:hypothetical protein